MNTLHTSIFSTYLPFKPNGLDTTGPSYAVQFSVRLNNHLVHILNFQVSVIDIRSIFYVASNVDHVIKKA